jgi:translation initiation factor IF-2
MRVHELAKKLGTTNKDLIERLHEVGADVKTASNAVTEEQAEAVRKLYEEEARQVAEAAAAAAQPKPEPTPEPDVAAESPETAATGEVAPSAEEAEAEPEPEEPAGPIIVKNYVVVKELAEYLSVKPNQLIAKLMAKNIFASINEKLDFKIARDIAAQYDVVLEQEKKAPEKKPAPPPPPPPEEKIKEEKPTEEDMLPRPPVVTFLGHVDHGKTSLLDKIRNAHVVSGEHGGITQHIGAYTVPYNDNKITFIDTPGHAAFTAMRARGANLTDIAVIIVAADDGVMPQTREAIQHARAANVALMVAVNKVDLATANVDRVKQQLQQADLAPEDWGGQTIVCPVSAATGEGLDNLLEMILLQAEVLELKAPSKGAAQGFVVESRLEPGMGPTANVLVKRGTLKVGDALVCGPHWGRIKALISDTGVKVRTAGPSMAVKCLGLNNVPEAGAEFVVVANDREARRIAEERVQAQRSEKLAGGIKRPTSLDDLLRQTDTTEVKELNVVVKADVQGSLEAIVHSLSEIKSDKVKLNFILSGVGNITENDVILASASQAYVLGFNVAREAGANKASKREGVEIRLYNIIYEMVDDVRQAMTGLLKPVTKETIIGHAEVRQTFDIGKTGRIAGCMVTDGRVTSKSRARLTRGGDLIYTGTLSSLKRFQNDASEVREGQECGLRLDQHADYEAGDKVEFFEVQQVAQDL